MSLAAISMPERFIDLPADTKNVAINAMRSTADAPLGGFVRDFFGGADRADDEVIYLARSALSRGFEASRGDKEAMFWPSSEESEAKDTPAYLIADDILSRFLLPEEAAGEGQTSTADQVRQFTALAVFRGAQLAANGGFELADGTVVELYTGSMEEGLA